MVNILGHRGFSLKYPENTLLSFNKAFQNNADGIEADLQKTKDNKFVIIHDDNTDRICKKKYKINNLNLKQLKKIKLKNNQRILELKELLSIIPEGKFLNLELKKDTITKNDCKKIAEIIADYFNIDNLLISSFSHDLLFYFKKIKFKVGLLFGPEKKDMGYIQTLFTIINLKPDYFNLPFDMFKIFGRIKSIILLNTIKFFKKKIAFWVINDESQLKKIIKYSDVIITDDPLLIYNSINNKTIPDKKNKKIHK